MVFSFNVQGEKCDSSSHRLFPVPPFFSEHVVQMVANILAAVASVL